MEDYDFRYTKLPSSEKHTSNFTYSDSFTQTIRVQYAQMLRDIESADGLPNRVDPDTSYEIQFKYETTSCIAGDDKGFAPAGSSYAMLRFLNAEGAFLYNEADGDGTANG